MAIRQSAYVLAGGLVVAITLVITPVHAQEQLTGFPDGPGREQVVTACNSCHSVNRVKAGYTPDGWTTVIRMMQNANAPVDQNDWPLVQAYLVKNFPERQRPAAVVLPGPVEVTFKRWPLPTPGSRPHDPMAARDGAIWWSGQLANKIGRLDPKTGAMKEYVLERPLTAPHGLVEDKAGNVWFTGNSAGLIGKLDSNTGKVTEYPIPDPKARDPHSLIFDRDGILWFSVQVGNLVGRLDPNTGEMQLIRPQRPNSRPYGFAVDSKNEVWTVLFGTNIVARIDKAAMKLVEYPLLAQDARPRRIAITPDDMIWYTDYARGHIGRVDPKTGQVKEWQSPSGPKSQPYGMIATKGGVWYNESFAKPNTIVRFDPATEKFQSWAIPGGGDIVRNMAVNPDGNPVLSHSLMNEVGLIEVK